MKYLILALLICSTSFADTKETVEVTTGKLEINTAVPSYLKGATITVRLADGRESTVPAEKFKVVPRKQQFLTTSTDRKMVVTIETKQAAAERNKNRVSLLGGYGDTGGLTVTSSSRKSLDVENNIGAVGGLQYQRSLTERLSLGIQGQTNKTGSLLLGVDF